jgi:hypothetical protein
MAPWHPNCHLECQAGAGSRRYARMENLETNPKIDECTAAALLGLPLPDLRWFSRALGLGHKEDAGYATHTVFTYEELKRLSSEAAASAK